MNSLKLFSSLAILALIITVILLPLPGSSKIFLLVALAFCGIFVAVEAGRKGKLLAGLVIALLTLYLSVTLQRGFLFITGGNPAFVIIGIALIVLPILGAWAMIREIMFGSRIAQLAKIMDDAGELPEDNLPRTPSGRVDRQAADAEFEKYQQNVEKDSGNWKNWFNLSCLYDVAGDRKRARKAMRIAIALQGGKTPKDLSV